MNLFTIFVHFAGLASMAMCCDTNQCIKASTNASPDEVGVSRDKFEQRLLPGLDVPSLNEYCGAYNSSLSCFKACNATTEAEIEGFKNLFDFICKDEFKVILDYRNCLDRKNNNATCNLETTINSCNETRNETTTCDMQIRISSCNQSLNGTRNAACDLEITTTSCNEGSNKTRNETRTCDFEITIDKDNKTVTYLKYECNKIKKGLDCMQYAFNSSCSGEAAKYELQKTKLSLQPIAMLIDCNLAIPYEKDENDETEKKEPEEDKMEPWIAAVMTIGSVLGLFLIGLCLIKIEAIVQKKMKK